MPAATRLGDKCTGHGAFPPRVNDEASEDVMINNKGAHRVGDHWVTHCALIVCHDHNCEHGSSTVVINGKPAVRIGDEIGCGSIVAEGSESVFFG